MNRSIEEINKIVDIVLTDKDVQDALNDRILAKNLEELKKKKAFEDGEDNAMKKMAREMLKNNESIEKIILYTGLKEEDVQKLKEEKI